MELCNASEPEHRVRVCRVYVVETTDEITQNQTSQLKQELLKMYDDVCVCRVRSEWISWRWFCIEMPCISRPGIQHPRAAMEWNVFCIRSALSIGIGFDSLRQSIDVEILNEHPNFGSCNIQFSGKWNLCVDELNRVAADVA